MKLTDFKMMLGAMREVKDFDDSANFELLGGLQFGESTGVIVTFKDGDIDVTLETDISRLLGKNRG